MRLLTSKLIALGFLIALLQACAGLGTVIDGVPLPGNTKHGSAGNADSPMAGTWIGSWGGTLKHILVVESIAPDGKAKVIYAIGDEPRYGIERAWYRLNGVVSGNTLRVFGDGFTVRYQLTRHNRLLGVYERGRAVSSVVLTRHELADIAKPDAVVAWNTGVAELIQSDLSENGQAVQFEVVIHRPPGDGPFPLAIVNHGSTGRGNKPRRFTRTYYDAGLAELLSERGWLVAFPQRRGRGKSDGVYDEGFELDREQGYTCDPERSLAGAERALQDIEAIVAALRRRPDVSDAPVLMSGQSRGGALSVAYAARYPDQVGPVVNFVGGWQGEACDTASEVNQRLFRPEAATGKPTLWIYGEQDPFYSIGHSRENFAAFRKAGGQGRFLVVEVPGGNGHLVLQKPSLWERELDEYLQVFDGAAPDSRSSGAGAQ